MNILSVGLLLFICCGHASVSESDVPSKAAELNAFLQARAYSSFAHEASPHPSSGPHGVVQTYLNDVLALSVQSGSDVHPIGAAAVKELFDGDSVSGWSVSVKTSRGWYWYEIFSTEPGARAPYEGLAVPVCENCHKSGRDLVLTGKL